MIFSWRSCRGSRSRLAPSEGPHDVARHLSVRAVGTEPIALEHQEIASPTMRATSRPVRSHEK
jgi:hypothetical protein